MLKGKPLSLEHYVYGFRDLGAVIIFDQDAVQKGCTQCVAKEERDIYQVSEPKTRVIVKATDCALIPAKENCMAQRHRLAKKVRRQRAI